ncbi:hypothetical protein OAF42_03855 [Planctomicrobium sp.]|jgi:hypothetical protein|nr:hypothetical protein [Planctomicrobium sp.]MBT5018458.1 hypothetical protein [Planctomicrobium sp.]MDB4733559.1 hypothetical protein [Planctomicrobium sp.]
MTFDVSDATGRNATQFTPHLSIPMEGVRGRMTAQFAGSRSLDDRRRRRLATESDADTTSKSKSSSKKTPDSSASSITQDVESIRSDVVAEESMIPRALWKVCLYGCGGISAWIFLLWVNLNLPLSSGLREVFSPQAGTAFRLFSIFSLFVTSQLCFAIWWYRSRSRKDFGGRYRIWAWAGCFWSLTCLILGLGLHEPLAKFAYQTWPIYTWKPELLYWFVPFSIGVLALHQLISLDMRHSRSSRTLWNSTFICGCLTAGSLFGGDIVVRESLRPLLNAGLFSVWHFMISFTLLFHARFVVHVTNEAAPRQDLWFLKLKVKFSRGLQRVQKIFGKLLIIPRFGSIEKREAAALKKLERRELKAAQLEEKKLKLESAKADKLAAKQLANEEKVAAKQAKTQAKADAENARKEEKQAAELKRKAEKEEKQKEKAAQKVKEISTPKKQAPAPEPETQAEPERSAPRTKAGKKRKRVLGNNQRVDHAEEINPPHEVEAASQSKKVKKQSQQSDSFDDYDEDEDFEHMSKKQRRRARQQQRR